MARKFRVKPGISKVFTYSYEMLPGLVIEDDRLAGHPHLEEVTDAGLLISSTPTVGRTLYASSINEVGLYDTEPAKMLEKPRRAKKKIE